MKLLKTDEVTSKERKILSRLNKSGLKEFNFDRCERCGMEIKDKRFVVEGKLTDTSGEILYRKLADEILCDCCIDSYQNNYWDYGTLIERFGKEQAIKILQNPFRKMPRHIYKYLTHKK